MAENFSENVLINWNIEGARKSAEDLQATLLKTAESFESVRKAAASATSGIASSFDPVAISVEALNIKLRDTLALMEKIRAAGIPGISTSPAGTEGYIVQKVYREAGGSPSGGRWAQNPANAWPPVGETGGGGMDDDYLRAYSGRPRGGDGGDPIDWNKYPIRPTPPPPPRPPISTGGYGDDEYIARLRQAAIANQQVEESVKGSGEAANKANKDVDLLNNQWMRHLGWIMQTIVLMAALRVAYGFIQEVTKDILGLSDATARLNFVTGQGAEAARSGLLQESVRAARSGIEPTAAYSGALIAAQFGAPAETTKTASQIALLFGETKNYANVVQEVAQTVRRGNGEFDNQTRLLDLTATLYRSANLSMEAYFDSMQEAIPVSKLLGLSIEETAVIIARTAQVTEDTPKAASGFFAKIVQRISQPEVKAALATQYGIEGDNLADVIRQSAQMISQLEAAGQSDAAEKLAVLLSGGGGANAREDLKRLSISFDIFLETMNKGVTTAGAFDQMLGQVGQSGAIAFQQLTTAVQGFINVMANTGPFKVVIETVIGGARGVAETFNTLSEVGTGEEQFFKLSVDERRKRVADFNKRLGYEAISETLGVFHATPNEQTVASARANLPGYAQGLAGEVAQIALEKAFYEFSAGNLTGAEGPATALMGRGGRPVTGGFTYTEPREFGGIRDFPRGATAAEIQRQADIAEKTIAEATKGTTYDPGKKQTFFLYDEATKSFQEVTTTVDALSIAMKEATASIKDFAGFMELPKGTTLDDFQKLVSSFEPAIRGAELGTQDYEQQRRRLVPIGGRYQEVTGSDEALRRAQQQLQEAGSTFGGFRETPKGMDLDKLQASVKTWTDRIVNYEPGTQAYEEPKSVAFWDEGKKVWRTITAPMDALKFAIEENTKSQIKGIFNVPAGGEVLVAFQALQAGMMPSDRLGGTASPASDRLTGAGNRLNEAAAALIAAAARLGVVTSHMGTAFMTVKRFGTGLEEDAVGDTGVRDYGVLPQRNFGGGGGGRGVAQMSPTDIHIQRLLASQGGGDKSIVINNQSQLQMDGKIIATQLQTQMYRMLAVMRRSLTGGDPNSVLVG